MKVRILVRYQPLVEAMVSTNGAPAAKQDVTDYGGIWYENHAEEWPFGQALPSPKDFVHIGHWQGRVERVTFKVLKGIVDIEIEPQRQFSREDNIEEKLLQAGFVRALVHP